VPRPSRLTTGSGTLASPSEVHVPGLASSLSPVLSKACVETVYVPRWTQKRPDSLLMMVAILSPVLCGYQCSWVKSSSRRRASRRDQPGILSEQVRGHCRIDRTRCPRRRRLTVPGWKRPSSCPIHRILRQRHDLRHSTMFAPLRSAIDNRIRQLAPLDDLAV
jgi:hypothetical protein